MMLDFDLPVLEIEKRRQLIRDVWCYKKTDHIPVLLQIYSNTNGYTIHDEISSGKKQLKIRLDSIKQTLELVPDDYIPSIFVNMGCVGIENALGMEIHLGVSSEQMPGVKGLFVDHIKDIYDLRTVNPYRDGVLPEFLERMRYFAEETDHRIPLTCLDMNGPMAIAMDIIGSENLLLGMYEYPDDIHYLLDFTMENILRVTDACIYAAGGIENITCTDFCDYWFPEGKKGHVSDDVCAVYRKEMFQEFSIPVNNRIFSKYGPGLLHNCGPNPCVSRYLEHEPNITGVDLAYDYSRIDLQNFKKPFSVKGIIYLAMNFKDHQSTLNEYRHIVNTLVPDVIAIPAITIDARSVDSGECNPGKLYDELRKMSEEYAASIVWRV